MPKYHAIFGPGFFVGKIWNTPTGTSSISRNTGRSKQRNHGGLMRIKGIGNIGTLALMIMSALSFSLAGCGGGGGGLSSQVVSGVASVGATLSGQVSLKDASTTPKVKTTVIGSDGSYAIDVTDMKGPFIVEAAGSAGGTSYTLHSYADGPGTGAEIKPHFAVEGARIAGRQNIEKSLAQSVRCRTQTHAF
jgi:hypothetical protein